MSRRYVDLTDAKSTSKKFYNFRSWIMQPGNKGYNLRSGTKRRKSVSGKLQTSVKELSKVVQGYELAGEVQFIKQNKFIPSKKGNWNQLRLPCPKCNIDICKLPGWSCQNICCRSCLHSFCWECGESLAVKDFRPCNRPGFYLAQLLKARGGRRGNPLSQAGAGRRENPLSKAGAGRRGNPLSIAGTGRRGGPKIVKALAKCTFCGMRFRALSGLRTHMRKHIICRICSGRFSTKAKLMHHIREHSNKGIFRCYENPAAGRRAILRCVENPAVVKSRIYPARARKILFPTKQKPGRPRKKLFPAKRKLSTTLTLIKH